MLAAKQEDIKKEDISRLKVYHLIGEGYKAMQGDRMSMIEKVEPRMEKYSTANITAKEQVSLLAHCLGPVLSGPKSVKHLRSLSIDIAS